MSLPTLSRRTFLKRSTATGAGLLLAFYLPTGNAQENVTDEVEDILSPSGVVADTDPFRPNAWLSISEEGLVTVRLHKVEMGQGVMTALAVLVAEELEADWTRVRVQHATGNPAYQSPQFGNLQTTFGSSSVKESWEPLRRAGAAARAMLVTAAAAQWSVEESECKAENGTVLHMATRRTLSYGELSSSAATMRVPENVTLKNPNEWRLIGRQEVQRLDVPAKTNGTAVYASDVQLPGMLTATVLRSPVLGGSWESYDASKTLAVPGVRAVVELEGLLEAGVRPALAVVADHFWAAKLGRDALAVNWTSGIGSQSSETILQAMLAQANNSGSEVSSAGDVDAALAGSAQVIEGIYETPYLAHATMEPMSAVAHFKGDSLEVWVGHQSDSILQFALAGAGGLPPQQIRVNQTFMGCGWGRRTQTDFVIDAVQTSRAVNAPVKVLWTREEDMTQDAYHPASVSRLSLGLDEAGQVTGLYAHVVADSFLPGPPQGGGSPIIATGLTAYNLYEFSNYRVETSLALAGVSVGAWRGVAPVFNCFALESLLDEAATASTQDPYLLRRDLLAQDQRAVAVLDEVAKLANWDSPLGANQGRGIAFASYNGTYTAQVLEVEVLPDKSYTISRIVCVVDCGTVVNPDIVLQQIEGGIIAGIGLATKDEITIENGRVQQQNFDLYPQLRISETPTLEIHLIPSDQAPSGIGEPPVLAVAPALANALFSATRQRVRTLPLRLS
jgi:isoquinoline 1-oxidoreductase subunit beta